MQCCRVPLKRCDFWLALSFFIPYPFQRISAIFASEMIAKVFYATFFIWLTQPSIGPLFNILLSYSLKNLIGKDKLYRCFLKSCKIFGFGRRRKTKPFHLVSGWELLSLTFQDIERMFSVHGMQASFFNHELISKVFKSK